MSSRAIHLCYPPPQPRLYPDLCLNQRLDCKQSTEEKGRVLRLWIEADMRSHKYWSSFLSHHESNRGNKRLDGVTRKERPVMRSHMYPPLDLSLNTLSSPWTSGSILMEQDRCLKGEIESVLRDSSR